MGLISGLRSRPIQNTSTHQNIDSNSQSSADSNRSSPVRYEGKLVVVCMLLLDTVQLTPALLHHLCIWCYGPISCFWWYCNLAFSDGETRIFAVLLNQILQKSSTQLHNESVKNMYI